MVKALEAVAVTVIEPPNDTADPLIVTELLVSEALEMALRVFVAPLIDLPVSVCVSVKVTTVESIDIVPVPVIGPPVKPVPVLIWVTVPVPPIDAQ
jgi:hypothetical protein